MIKRGSKMEKFTTFVVQIKFWVLLTWLMFPPARPTSVGNQSVMWRRALETRLLRFSKGLCTNATPRIPPSQYVPWKHSYQLWLQSCLFTLTQHRFSSLYRLLHNASLMHFQCMRWGINPIQLSLQKTHSKVSMKPIWSICRQAELVRWSGYLPKLQSF